MCYTETLVKIWTTENASVAVRLIYILNYTHTRENFNGKRFVYIYTSTMFKYLECVK